MDMNNTRLCKTVFLWDYEISTNNWSFGVRTIMSLVDMAEHFQQMLKCDINSARNRPLDSYSTEWYTNLLKFPKLRTYRTFKTSFSTESYVELNLKRSERSVMAQFRCSILPLRLETGRFVGEPEYQRICKMCDSGQVENELHFLLECQFYNELRNQLLSGLNATVLNLNNSEKLKLLLSEYPIKTARYLVQSLAKRKNHLYLNNINIPTVNLM
jgi:hypothetical protein